VAVLNYRRSPRQIIRYLKFLWVHHSRSLYGITSWASHNSDPPPIWGDFIEEKFERPDGTAGTNTNESMWDLKIGVDPYLRARIVDDLRVEYQEIEETVFWRERPPGSVWNERPKAYRNAEIKSYTRQSRSPLHTRQ